MNVSSRCIIVGASHAGVAAAFALRKVGWAGAISLLGDEPELPYHRPPLSKAFLTGGKSLDQIRLRPESAYQDSDIKLRLATRVAGIDRDSCSLKLGSGESMVYDALILATGATARRLPLPGADLPGVFTLRNAADIDAIRVAAGSAKRAVIIGGGYIGLEVAATFRQLGLAVTVIEAADRVLARVAEPAVSAFYQRLHEEEGVEFRMNAGVESINGAMRCEAVGLGSDELVPADIVVLGVGVTPNVALAEVAGLAIDNGVVTDEFARTSDERIYAIGDCANTKHLRYEQSLRVESVQNASDLALTAAHAICGADKAYDAVPWFWSDQYDVKLQIAGLTLGADAVVARGDSTRGRAFSLCYLKAGRLVAVEAVNQPRDFAFARQLLGAAPQMDRDRLLDPNCSLKDCVLE